MLYALLLLYATTATSRTLPVTGSSSRSIRIYAGHPLGQSGCQYDSLFLLLCRSPTRSTGQSVGKRTTPGPSGTILIGYPMLHNERSSRKPSMWPGMRRVIQGTTHQPIFSYLGIGYDFFRSQSGPVLSQNFVCRARVGTGPRTLNRSEGLPSTIMMEFKFIRVH